MSECKDLLQRLILVVEGTDMKYGLWELIDGYYLDHPDIIAINELLEEAKTFLENK